MLLQPLKSIPKSLVGASRFERPVRPPHPLGGVTKVAPYSSRRHPPAPKAGALTRLRYAPPLFRNDIDNIYYLIRQPPNLLLFRKMS